MTEVLKKYSKNKSLYVHLILLVKKQLWQTSFSVFIALHFIIPHCSQKSSHNQNQNLSSLP